MAVWAQASLLLELDICFVGFASCTVSSNEKACCLSCGTAEHVGRQLGTVEASGASPGCGSLRAGGTRLRPIVTQQVIVRTSLLQLHG